MDFLSQKDTPPPLQVQNIFVVVFTKALESYFQGTFILSGKRINLESVIVFAVIFACVAPLLSQNKPLRRNRWAEFKDRQTDKGRLLSLTEPQSEYRSCQISMVWVNNLVQAFIAPHLLFLRAYVCVYRDYCGELP